MAKDFQIIAQRQSTTVDTAGALRDVVVVSFQTPSGATGSVRVPLESYNADEVNRLVSAQAAEMEAVAEL